MSKPKIEIIMNEICTKCDQPGATNNGLCLSCVNKSLKFIDDIGPWSKADSSVITTAKTIIDQYHPSLQNARIGFLFLVDSIRSQGKNIYAKSSKVSAQMKPFLDLDYIIWITESFWTDLPESQREALIDHELCHCNFRDEDNPKISGHDIEEFLTVLDRHGYWSKSLFLLEDQTRQLKMNFNRDQNNYGSLVSIDPEKVYPHDY